MRLRSAEEARQIVGADRPGIRGDACRAGRPAEDLGGRNAGGAKLANPGVARGLAQLGSVRPVQQRMMQIGFFRSWIMEFAIAPTRLSLSVRITSLMK